MAPSPDCRPNELAVSALSHVFVKGSGRKAAGLWRAASPSAQWIGARVI
jgi:hypothetical protein